MIASQSSQESSAAEDAQDELVERGVDVRLDVRDGLRRAETFDVGEVLTVGVGEALEDLRSDGDFALVAGFAVVQEDVAVELRFGFLAIDDVDDEGIELVVAEDVDPLLEALRVVEIGDEDREALSVCPSGSSSRRKRKTLKMRALPRVAGMRSITRSVVETMLTRSRFARPT
jgi:hypothetical protein